MYVIYHGKGDSILTSMAAALHLNRFSFTLQHQPNILPVEAFRNVELEALGRLVYIGTDCNNNKVFVLSTGVAETIILPALSSVFDLLQVPQQHLYLADISQVESFPLALGLWLYKRSFLKGLAYKLIFKGVKSEYNKLEKIVERTKIFSENK